MNTTTPRRYSIGDTVPEHGWVLDISTTAYLVAGPIRYEGDPYWVPFYGPYGVDPVGAVTPLVVLS